MVNRIIAKPILGIPIRSITQKIPSIIRPSNLAIGPKINPESFVNKIPLIYPPSTTIPNYGTGSYPPFEKGLHLKILQIVSNPPLNAPYFCIASNPYCEQVGIYWQHLTPL